MNIRSCSVLGVTVLFALWVLFKLSGSSVAMYENLYGAGKPEGLLLFTPKKVRSDEWMVWTPGALSQARQHPAFPVENANGVGGGWAPFLLNLPVAYYTTWFRPQFWGFFIFDFERGFSFAWGVKLFGLLLALAWFFRQFLRSIGMVALATLWTFLMLQWWFSSPAMLVEMIACAAICTCCAIQFLKQTNLWRLILAFVAFVFCGVNFLLCLYPPWQVPLAFVMMAVFIGVFVELNVENKRRAAIRAIVLLVAATCLIAIALIPFYIDFAPTTSIIKQTVYPGARRSTGGALSFFQLFSGFTGFFQSETVFPLSFGNICEAHQTFVSWPIVFAAVVAARYRHGIKISPLVIALVILILALSIYCIVPLPAWLLNATLLSFSTERRTMVAIGMANICLTCLFLDRYRSSIFSKRSALVWAFVFCAAIALLLFMAARREPGLFPDRNQILLSYGASAILVALFFWERQRLFVAMLIVFLIATEIHVNPVMSGLAPLTNSETFKTIDKIRAADPSAKWIVYDSLQLPDLVRATGAPMFNGTRNVPDVPLIHQFDPENRGLYIYNRYGHMVCQLPPEPDILGFRLIGMDTYLMEIAPDYPLLKEIGCRYVVFPNDWPEAESRGLTLVEKVPGNGICIYRWK